jgi:hypothetical protein
MTDYAALTTTIRELRSIHRDAQAALTAGQAALDTTLSRIKALELALVPQGEQDFGEPLTLNGVEYDTIIGRIARADYLRLVEMRDPVRETLPLGMLAAALRREGGYPSVSVKAPPAITTRFPKIRSLNAYPVEIIERVLAGN